MAKNKKENLTPIRLSRKSQLSEGFHGTTTSEDKLKVGDTLIPSDERRGTKRTEKALGDKTYFATTEDSAWKFNSQMVDSESENRFGDYKAPPRTRVFKTAPSQDQGLDRNYLRSTLESIKFRQDVGQLPSGVRGMINEAKRINHRVAGRQSIISEQFGPPAPEGGRTDIGLVGGGLNWHEYGYPNWTVHNQGGSWDSLGGSNDGEPLKQDEGSLASSDWKKGTSVKRNGKWETQERPKPRKGDVQLDLGSKWTEDPEDFVM